MAMSVGPDRGRPVASINVTPLIDVMLVLLILCLRPELGTGGRFHLSRGALEGLR